SRPQLAVSLDSRSAYAERAPKGQRSPFTSSRPAAVQNVARLCGFRTAYANLSEFTVRSQRFKTELRYRVRSTNCDGAIAGLRRGLRNPDAASSGLRLRAAAFAPGQTGRRHSRRRLAPNPTSRRDHSDLLRLHLFKMK